MAVLVYNYHPKTGVLLSTTEADESPLEPDHFLIPAYATRIQPPAVPQGSHAIFDGKAWRLEVDLESIRQRIKAAPGELFGGPTLGETYGL